MTQGETTKVAHDAAQGEVAQKDAAEVKVSNETSTEAKAAPVQQKRKKGRRTVTRGQAHIKCTYNNTIISLTDRRGRVLAWSSAGSLGFKGAKKATPYAATQVARDVAEKVRKHQLSDLDVFIKGVGSGREASIRGLAANGFTILSIRDVTPVPHNGCRQRKPRRV